MKNIRLQLTIFAVLGGFLLISLPVSAQTLPVAGDPQSLVCIALANIMPCGTSAPVANKSTADTSSTKPASTSSILASIFGFGSSSKSTTANRNMTSNISQGFLGKAQKNFAVVLVKAPNHPEIYRIIGGKKFLIPNDTVFDSYGYLQSDIKTMSWSKIQSYPRVKLIKFDGHAEVYYLTERGMTRVIPNETIFNSYADNGEDIVIVNKIEFSMYPQNKYIFNEATYTIDRQSNTYVINSGTKKLVFPDQLVREGITNSMIAPVNQTEFDYYSNSLILNTAQRTWFNFF